VSVCNHDLCHFHSTQFLEMSKQKFLVVFFFGGKVYCFVKFGVSSLEASDHHCFSRCPKTVQMQSPRKSL